MARGRLHSAGVVAMAAAMMVSTSAVMGVAPASPVAAAGPSTAALVPVTPCRLLDTRQPAETALSAGTTRTVTVAGECAVAREASAVAVTITVVEPGAAGFLALWPSGDAQPDTSTVGWSVPGDVRANSTIVALGAGGAIDLFANATTNVLIDVTAAFVPATSATSGRFVALDQARVLDTRTTGRPAPMTPVVVGLPPGVPADALAVAVNITTTETSGPGFVSAFPADGGAPATSVLNATGADQTVAASTIVPIGDGSIAVLSQRGDHLLVDVVGWFTGDSAAPGTDGLFVAATPTRLADTRPGKRPVYTGGSVPVPLGPAAGAQAVVANVTVTEAWGPGHLTAFASSRAKPDVSTINYAAGQTVANQAIVPVSTAGLSLFAGRTTHVVVDLVGSFTGTPLAATGGWVDRNDPPPLPGCPASGRAAVADKAAQRFWLCEDGLPVTEALPMTTAGLSYGLPPIGTYKVFARLATNRGIHGERLKRFVAFYTTSRGNRIAFHEVVNQRADTVGDLAMRGASSGCFRLRPADSIRVWDFLRIGDVVVVITK